MRQHHYIGPVVTTFDCCSQELLLAGSVTTVDSGDAGLIINDGELETGRSREDDYFFD
jgi:hypothetical protein